jgi:putative transposase
MAVTVRLKHRRLPHWEVENGRYFVTVRCHDSLPLEVVNSLREQSATLHKIVPHSAAFALHQRETFRTLEKYLDAGCGTCPLKSERAYAIVLDEFAALSEWRCTVPHYSVMPNHWHALLVPEPQCKRTLSEIMKRLKGRTAKRIRTVCGGVGPLWQREWFDRWMRNDTEWERCIAYVRNNPVKAGLVGRWEDHAATR